MITADNHTMTASDWADTLNVPASTIRTRLGRDLDSTQAVFGIGRKPPTLTLRWVTLTVGTWATVSGTEYWKILARSRRRWTPEASVFGRNFAKFDEIFAPTLRVGGLDRMVAAALTRDFLEYTRISPATNAVVGRMVPHDSILEGFVAGGGVVSAFPVFSRKACTRWTSWCKFSDLDQADRGLWTRSFYAAMGVSLID